MSGRPCFGREVGVMKPLLIKVTFEQRQQGCDRVTMWIFSPRRQYPRGPEAGHALAGGGSE